MEGMNFLIIRYDPAIGGLVRATLTKHGDLIAGKRQWRDRDKICLDLTLARPDGDDEGKTTSFRYSLDAMVSKLKDDGVSVEARGKAA